MSNLGLFFYGAIFYNIAIFGNIAIFYNFFTILFAGIGRSSFLALPYFNTTCAVIAVAMVDGNIALPLQYVPLYWPANQPDLCNLCKSCARSLG